MRFIIHKAPIGNNIGSDMITDKIIQIVSLFSSDGYQVRVRLDRVWISDLIRSDEVRIEYIRSVGSDIRNAENISETEQFVFISSNYSWLNK